MDKVNRLIFCSLIGLIVMKSVRKLRRYLLPDSIHFVKTHVFKKKFSQNRYSKLIN
jgi:hypothetical protein